jgi:DNA repair protein RecN (Recombination protein N)
MVGLEFSRFRPAEAGRDTEMLRFLRISHLAVIESAEVEFDAGLNVLTGETGAGKSILVEAVGLLLGGRASGDLVRTGEESASIEAIFESAGPGGSGDNELLVRREITAQGRSRAFINGALATAGALKELSARLVELHGQHEHQTLLDSATHLGVLDAFGQLEALLAPTRASFETMRAVEQQVADLRRALADRNTRHDLLTFQLGELDRVAPREGEDEQLAAERRILASAERVERLCAESYTSLYESDGAILAGLGNVWRRVGELATLDPQFQPYLDARDAIKPQLEDLAIFLRRYAEGIGASSGRLHEVEERLALLERLKRKYGPALSDVVARRQSLRGEMSALDKGDDRLVELEREQVAARAAYVSAAGLLSTARRAAAKEFSQELERLLAELAMERTRFDVRFADPPSESGWTADGLDSVEFFVSPNPGEDLRPLARIVSGGELSRIMLAIKTLTFGSRLARIDASGRAPGAAAPHGAERLRGAGAPGLIFDEVDAGIGGRVAEVVGRKLRALGSAFQVLCITHLPQIAAYADTHFQIEKRVERGRTVTTVKRLDAAGRVDELARMLGGEAITDGLRASAREMLAGRGSEAKSKGESERAKGETTERRAAVITESGPRKRGTR